MRVNPWILTLLTGAIVSLVAWKRFDATQQFERTISTTNIALLRIESEIRLRSALDDHEMSRQGFVRVVDPTWFEGDPPQNRLLTGLNRPWIDVDGHADRSIRNPTTIFATEGDAQWWYNPANGVIRARVPGQPTIRATRELYDRVNR